VPVATEQTSDEAPDPGLEGGTPPATRPGGLTPAPGRDPPREPARHELSRSGRDDEFAALAGRFFLICLALHLAMRYNGAVGSRFSN
jgi:hypothetical protein